MLNANMRQRLSGIARSLFVAVLMFATLFPFYWTLLIDVYKRQVYILNKGKVVLFVDKDETREAKSFICC